MQKKTCRRVTYVIGGGMTHRLRSLSQRTLGLTQLGRLHLPVHLCVKHSESLLNRPMGQFYILIIPLAGNIHLCAASVIFKGST